MFSSVSIRVRALEQPRHRKESGPDANAGDTLGIAWYFEPQRKVKEGSCDVKSL